MNCQGVLNQRGHRKGVPRELTLAERSQYVCCYFGSKHSCVLTYRRLGNFIVVGHWHTSSIASCYFWANISPQHFAHLGSLSTDKQIEPPCCYYTFIFQIPGSYTLAKVVANCTSSTNRQDRARLSAQLHLWLHSCEYHIPYSRILSQGTGCCMFHD